MRLRVGEVGLREVWEAEACEVKGEERGEEGVASRVGTREVMADDHRGFQKVGLPGVGRGMVGRVRAGNRRAAEVR